MVLNSKLIVGFFMGNVMNGGNIYVSMQFISCRITMNSFTLRSWFRIFIIPFDWKWKKIPWSRDKTIISTNTHSQKIYKRKIGVCVLKIRLSVSEAAERWKKNMKKFQIYASELIMRERAALFIHLIAVVVTVERENIYI